MKNYFESETRKPKNLNFEVLDNKLDLAISKLCLYFALDLYEVSEL